MSLLTAVLGGPRGDAPRRRSLENPSVPLSSITGWDEEEGWVTGGPGCRPASGVRVNRRTALGYAPFWRGVNLIAKDVAKLPFYVYRRQGGGKEPAADHPAYPLLLRKPNRHQNHFQFKKQLTGHALCHGNGYAWIERDQVSSPMNLWPLDPKSTYAVRAGGTVYYITEAAGRTSRLAADDVFHLQGLGYDGLTGYDVLSVHRETLGLGLGARQYGSIYFRNSGRPALVLQHPANISQAAADRLKARWNEMYTGLDNAHRTAVLEEGMTAKLIGSDAEKAQLTETLKLSVRDVANVLGLPPHKLGDDTRTSLASLEQENQDYLDGAVDPWLCCWEAEAWDKLLTEREKAADTHVVEFMRAALVRADMQARYAAYNVAYQTGVLSPDDIRAKENMGPRPDGGGKDYIVPLNVRTTAARPPAVPGGQAKDLLALATAVQAGDIAPAAAMVVLKATWPDMPAAQAQSFITALEAAPPPVVPVVPAVPKQLPATPEPAPARALTEAAGRALRRVGKAARRAAHSAATWEGVTAPAPGTRLPKRPPDFRVWLANMPAEHRAGVARVLAPALPEGADPLAAADRLLGLAVEALADAGVTPADQLEGRVGIILEGVESDNMAVTAATSIEGN